MATFADMTARLNLNFQNFTSGLRTASAQVSRFASELNGQINAGMADPAKKAKFEFKDVARIVQGIIISKIFYSGLNAIRNATQAVWEFSKELEYAKIAYTNLFGDPALAQEFINVLKDFAAVTPFTFTDAEKAAKRLLAYGIEYKNVMYVMQGVLAASTMQGNPQVIESISRALGQIYTKGRLMNEEMRQLAEAGIPAYEILAEKLGLTNEQLRNLGKNAIPANVAINALVEGINERFGGVLDASSKTITGLISNIKDNALMLFSGIFEPLTVGIKGVLEYVGTLFAELRAAFDTGGIGAVFERLIPPELHATIRTLIANLLNLWNIIKTNLISIWSMFKQVILGVVQALNVLLPIVNTVLGVFAAVTKVIADNEQLMKLLVSAILACAAAWAIYKVQALTAALTTKFIAAITAAVKGLGIALNFIAAHPVWAVLALGIALLVGFSGAAGKVGDAIRGMFKSLTSIGSVDPDKLLLPDQKDRAASLDKFNKRLGETEGAMDDLADKTGKATKAAKGLLSFDEVFKLNQPDEGTDAGATDWGDWGDWDIPDLSGLGGVLPDMPEINTMVNDFVDNIIEALGGKEKLLSAAIGGLLGGILGGITGGPIGAKIGAAIGAFVGWFWPEIAKALGLTDIGTVALPIATVLGAAIGFIAGGPLGAVIGAGIGALVGWIIDAIARTFETGDWTSLALPVGIGLGAAIGMIAGGPVGAAIGAAIGAFVGWLVDLIVDNWDAIADWFKGVGQWFADIGKSIGKFFSDLGKGIGQFFSDLWTDITNWWKAVTAWFSNALSAIGTFIGNFLQIFVILGQGFWNLLTIVGNALADLGNIVWTALTDLFKMLGQAGTDLLNILGGWFGPILSAIGNFFSGIWTTVSTWFSNIWTSFTIWLGNVWTAVSTWFSNIWTSVSTWFSNMWTSFTTWIGNVWSSITTWLGNIWSTLSGWFINVISAVSNWLSPIFTTIGNFFTNVWNTFTTWIGNVWNSISTWFTNLITSIGTWLGNIWTNVSTWFSTVWTGFTTWLGNIWTNISTWFTTVWNGFTTWLGNIWNSISTWFTNLVSSISTWLSNVWNNISGWTYTTSTNIMNWFTNLGKGIAGWGARLLTDIINWLGNLWRSIWNELTNIGTKIANWWDSLWKGKSATVSVNANTSGVTSGHAVGGIFNREHVARFAEGNKAEAVIPLENAGAMQPFVDAIADGITASLMPFISSMTGAQSEQLQPLLVGTLIADDRSLRELNRRMHVIQLKETGRRGV